MEEKYKFLFVCKFKAYCTGTGLFLFGSEKLFSWNSNPILFHAFIFQNSGIL